jgi:hypothetical protein
VKVIRAIHRAHSIIYLRFHYYEWVETSAGELLIRVLVLEYHPPSTFKVFRHLLGLLTYLCLKLTVPVIYYRIKSFSRIDT